MTSQPLLDLEAISNDDPSIQKLGKSTGFRGMFNFLLKSGGFGEDIKTQAQVAYLFYGHKEPTRNDGGDKRLEEDDRTSGLLRLRNLMSAGGSFSDGEALEFHKAFRQVFGDEWATAITPKELVLNDSKETISKTLGAGLPWPIDLNISSSILALCLNQADTNFRIQPYDPSKLNLTAIGDQSERDWQWVDELPLMFPDQKYGLQVSGKMEPNTQILLLEVPDNPVTYKGGNQAFSAFNLGIKDFDQSVVRVLEENNTAFKILDLQGCFHFVAIALPNGFCAQKEFGISQSEPYLTDEQSQNLVRKLRAEQLKTNTQMQITHYSYRVV